MNEKSSDPQHSIGELRYYLDTEKSMKMHSDFRTVKNIEVLQRFPGLEEFYESQIKSRLLAGVKFRLYGTGPSGAGKETIIGQLLKLLTEAEDLQLQLRQQDFGLGELPVATFSPFLKAAQKIPVLNSETGQQNQINGRKEWLIDQEAKHGHYRPYQFARAEYLMRYLDEQLEDENLMTELPGFPRLPKLIHTRILWDWIATLPQRPENLFIGVAPGPKQLVRNFQFRQAMADATPDNYLRIAQECGVLIDEDDVADMANFNELMGNVHTTELTLDLYQQAMLWAKLQGAPLMRGYEPKDLEDLKERHERLPEMLSQDIKDYLNFELSRLGFAPDNLLVGINEDALDEGEQEDEVYQELDDTGETKETQGIHFYRRRVKQHLVTIPTDPWIINPKSSLGVSPVTRFTP